MTLTGQELIELLWCPLDHMKAIPRTLPVHHSVSPVRSSEEDRSSATAYPFKLCEPQIEPVNMLDHLQREHDIVTVVRKWDAHSVVDPETDVGRRRCSGRVSQCFGVDLKSFIRTDLIGKGDRPVTLAKTDLEHRRLGIDDLTDQLVGEAMAGIRYGLFDAPGTSADMPFSGRPHALFSSLRGHDNNINPSASNPSGLLHEGASLLLGWPRPSCRRIRLAFPRVDFYDGGGKYRMSGPGDLYNEICEKGDDEDHPSRDHHEQRVGTDTEVLVE